MADQTFIVNCGFFDSINHDRLYASSEMNRPYKRVITNGVFATPKGTPSTDLQVSATGRNMTITVAPGEGLFGDKWFQNPSVMSITVPANTNIVPRRDSVIAQVDNRQVGRVGNIVYRTGTPSSNPVAPAINTVDNVREYRIATIYVGPGVTSIYPADITDMRGSQECPWVTGLINQVDTTELFREYEDAYARYYADSTETFDNWSEEKKEQFEQWLENLTQQLTVATNVIILNNTHISAEAESVIPIGIPSYDKTTDALLVFINGLKVTEDVNYEIDVVGENITLSAEILAGQIVNFFVLKSVIAADIQTTATMIEVLDGKVGDVQEVTDRIELVSYVATGTNDNVALSNKVKEFLSEAQDGKQMRIYVSGVLGVASVYDDGVWFDFTSQNATRKVSLDFSNCAKIEIDNTQVPSATGFIVGETSIYGLNVSMRNCTDALMFDGKLDATDCEFEMTGTGDICVGSNGSFSNCKFFVRGGTDVANCIRCTDLVTLNSCRLIAYNGSSASVESAAVITDVNSSDTVVIMNGCSCPVIELTGYKQDQTVDITNGFYFLAGNMLGQAGNYYATGDGKTETGTMIVSK